MFDRPHHQRIAKLLASLDAEFLAKAGCYFGGGTAITLLLDEYRESVDVDFLCGSGEGYRLLRNEVTNASFGEIMSHPVDLAREIRVDRYGIRTYIMIDETPIKFEIIREDRIEISGDIDLFLGVPTLARVDMYAEKLLANTDREGDIAATSRDIIDLAMMINRWGPIPDEAWRKARLAYGKSVDRAYAKAIQRIENSDYLSDCLAKMQMQMQMQTNVLARSDLTVDIPGLLRAGASSSTKMSGPGPAY